MLLQQTPAAEPNLETVLTDFFAGIVSAVPNVLSGILFLVLAYISIRIILAIVRSVLDRVYPEDQELIVDLLVVVVGIFLWFGAALALLKIVGLGEVAASLGTAAGFIGLGIAFALKEMIADTVAGIYLLRDADFNVGESVETASVTGTIRRIDLRKTRIENEDGDLIVLANRDVEKKWTQHSGSESDHETATTE